jgi:hypothetical protein
MEMKEIPSRKDPMRLLSEKAAIHKFGTLDDLPAQVRNKLLEVYDQFVPVYLEIIRIRDNHSSEWRPDDIEVDPEVVEEMRHFFSDYQTLTNDFIRINRRIFSLKAIDPDKEPYRYRAAADAVVGKASSTADIMRQIVE